jgi:hypothetical protein
MASHTSTGEWKSFEIRMRRRRAEHLVVRAEAALDAGCVDDAREALHEARRLAPDLPQIVSVEHSIDAFQNAARVKQLTRPRDVSLSLALGAILLAATAGAVWWTTRTPTAPPSVHSPAFSIAQPHTPSPSPAPHSVIVEQQPITVAEIALRTPAPADVEAERLPAPTSEPPRVMPTSAALVTDIPTPVRDERDAAPIATVGSIPAADIAAPTSLASPAPVAAGPAASAPAAKPAVENTSPADDVLVQRTLQRYATAYSQLDADAAQQVWPSVNRGALARAFGDLALQQVSLGSCRIDVRGAAAHAACAGTATWAPKVGDHGPRTEARNWNFELMKAGAAWQIVSARVQNK